MAEEQLKGRVALITGGNRGIGLATAKRLAKAGAVVVVCGRSVVELPEGIHFMACDVRDADSVKKMVADIVAQFGGIDILVNNAGGSPPAVAATASPRFSERVIALNLLAPIHCCQAVYETMQQRGGGAIVNIASVAAKRPSPGTAAYSAGKAGLIAYTNSLAHEWGPKIRLNSIIVGYIETENTENTYGNEAAQKAISANIAAGRLGKSNEIAEAVLFLVSDAASYVTGAELAVHGGGERPPFLDLVAEHGA